MANKPDNRFTFEVEGRKDQDKIIWLRAFADQIVDLSKLFNRFDDLYAPGESNELRIIDLRRTNPAVVEVEVCNENNPDSASRVVSNASRVFTSLRQGIVPDDLDAGALGAIAGLTEQVGKKVGSMTWASDGTTVELGRAFADLANARLRAEEEEYGSIEGLIEQINIHENANSFRLYPDVGPTSVSCSFTNELKDLAIAAVGRKVSVRGLITYPATERFPRSIKVDEIDIYPDVEDLPRFRDLLGIVRRSEDEPASEDLIARMRDEWI